MSLFKNVNGVDVPLSENELLEYSQRQASWDESHPERLTNNIVKNLEFFIAEKVSEKQYSSAASCASYQNSTNQKWAEEANAFIVWRDICYETAIQYEKDVQQGITSSSSASWDDLLAKLPSLSWPT